MDTFIHQYIVVFEMISINSHTCSSISLTSVVVKVMERIYHQLTIALESNKLISSLTMAFTINILLLHSLLLLLMTRQLTLIFSLSLRVPVSYLTLQWPLTLFHISNCYFDLRVLAFMAIFHHGLIHS